MRRLIGFIAAMLIASGVIAAPVVWTVPPTLLSDGSTVSGTFTYDTATTTLSNVNFVSTGTVASSFQFPAPGFLTIAVVALQTATPTPGVTRAVVVEIPGIPANGGPYTSPNVVIGTCTGLCTGIGPNGSHADVLINGAALVAAPVSEVPTLSEYAMLVLASLLAMFGVWQMRKRGMIGEKPRSGANNCT